jgi:hypothetical protein
VTLGRLILAWLPVAVWFLAARWATRRWLFRETDVPPPWRPGATPARAAALEAVGVTLFASLWFDSLGHGDWWLLFLLVGLLVAFAPRFRDPPAAAPLARRTLLLAGFADVARYVGAGAVLAAALA